MGLHSDHQTVNYNRQIPVRKEPDVFIAGGGPAGVAAAVAAARAGRRVFLVEPFPALGGAAVNMLVPGFMTFGDGEHFLADGVGREVRDRIRAAAPERFAKYCPDSIPAEILKNVYDEMLQEAGAEFVFYTGVIDAVVKDGAIDCVICAAKSDIYAVKASVYIDCTGDGELSFFAGAESEYGDEEGRVMAATLCGVWSGVEEGAIRGGDKRRLEEAFRDGVFQNEDRHLPGMWRLMAQSCPGVPDGVTGSNAGHVYDVDPRDSASLTRGVLRGRRQLQEYRTYYRGYVSGYENAELIASAPYLGIREGRRVTCDCRLTLDDFLRRAVFPDEIGRYCYNIDIHSPTNDAAGYEKFITEHTGYRLPAGESYGIPYRCLAVKGLKNLLTAGKCICTDRYMQSSVRVMPGCYITGQAAGTAAAVLCADAEPDVHHADVPAIQSELLALGAYLPNAFAKET